MTKEEKMFCIDMLLRDVRGNWADNPLRRTNKAYNLCNELGGKFLELAKEIKERGGYDGRYFRAPFPRGYEGIPHGLKCTFRDKSEECREVLTNYLTFPQFDDL